MSIKTWKRSQLTLKQNQVTNYDLKTDSNIVMIINRTATGGGKVYIDERETVSTTSYALHVEQGHQGSFVRPYDMKTIYLTTDGTSVNVELIEIKSESFTFTFNAGQLVDIQGQVTVEEPVTIDGTVNISGDVEVKNDSGNPLPVNVNSSLPAGDNNIGNVDVVSLPALPAGNNNIGDVDVATLPQVEKKGFTYQEVTAGGAGEVTVKASAGRVVSLTSDGTASVQLRDGTGNNVWKAITGEVHFPEPVECTTDIILNFDQAGTAYIIYE